VPAGRVCVRGVREALKNAAITESAAVFKCGDYKVYYEPDGEEWVRRGEGK
jgi:hypothetical protein